MERESVRQPGVCLTAALFSAQPPSSFSGGALMRSDGRQGEAAPRIRDRRRAWNR